MTSVFTGADESWAMSLVLRSQILSDMDEIQQVKSEMKLVRGVKGKNKDFYI